MCVCERTVENKTQVLPFKPYQGRLENEQRCLQAFWVLSSPVKTVLQDLKDRKEVIQSDCLSHILTGIRSALAQLHGY